MHYAKIFIISCVMQASAILGGELTTTYSKDASYMLDCSEQQLTEILPMRPGAGAYITHIDARGNNIKRIDKDALATLTQLAKLDLSKNNLEQIASGAFENSRMLTELNLRDHRIATFPRQLFCRLLSLSWLDLTTEKSMSLPHGIFYDQSSSLRHLLLASKVIFDWKTNRYKDTPCAESLFTHQKGEAQSPDEIPLIVSFTGNRPQPQLVSEFLDHCFGLWTGAANCSSPFAALQPVSCKS